MLYLVTLHFSINIMLTDNMKKALVQGGVAEHLANNVSSCKDVAGDEILKQRTQSAADMIVMLLTEGNIFSSLCCFCYVFF